MRPQSPFFLASFALLAALCAASISEIMFQSQSIDYTHMLCLNNRGALDQFFIQGELESTEEFKFFISSVDFQGLEDHGLQPHFNITLDSLHFYSSPEITAGYYATALQKYYYKMLWFDVTQTELEINCDMIWTFINRIKTLTGKPLGIIGNRDDWVDKFGSDKECSKFSIYPLYYSGEGNFQNFAGWTGYSFAKGKEHYGVCGVNYTDVLVGRGNSLTTEPALA